MMFFGTVVDVFEEGKGAYLVHCISSDFAMGAGIALKFREMGVADLLNANYPEVCKNGVFPCCLETTAGTQEQQYCGVFNLVTKQKVWQKPTYDTLRAALEDMREQILEKQKVNGNKTVKVCMQ